MKKVAADGRLATHAPYGFYQLSWKTERAYSVWAFSFISVLGVSKTHQEQVASF